MSIAARCTCGRMGSGFGESDGYCPRHTSTPRPTGAPPTVGDYLRSIEDHPLNTTPVVSQKPANVDHKAIAQELRDKCAALRKKPIPLAELIPLMQRAADALDAGALPFDRHYVFGYLAASITHGLEKGDEEIEKFADWLVPDGP